MLSGKACLHLCSTLMMTLFFTMGEKSSYVALVSRACYQKKHRLRPRKPGGFRMKEPPEATRFPLPPVEDNHGSVLARHGEGGELPGRGDG